MKNPTMESEPKHSGTKGPSEDAHIPLQQSFSSELTQEKEFAQFKSNFLEISAMAYLVQHMINREQDSRREEARGKSELNAIYSSEEGGDKLADVLNGSNAEAILANKGRDELIKICTGALDKEYSKVKDNPAAQEYYEQMKSGIESHIAGMDRELRPKIEALIENVELSNPRDSLADDRDAEGKLNEKIRREVYTGFEAVVKELPEIIQSAPKKKAKKSVKFREETQVQEIESFQNNITKQALAQEGVEASALKPKKPKKSVGFKMGGDEVHLIETEITEAKYPDRPYEQNLKSPDADVPLQRKITIALTAEQELAQFLANVVERSAEAYLVAHLRENNKEFLEQDMQAKQASYKKDVNREGEEFSEAIGIKNKENLEKSLQDKANISKDYLAILDSEMGKVQNREFIEPYFNAMKANIKPYAQKMEQDLAPKIDSLIQKETNKNEFNPEDHLDVDSDRRKWHTKINAAVQNEFKRDISTEKMAITKENFETKNMFSFYKKIANFCEQHHLPELVVEFFRKKQLEMQVNSLKMTLVGKEASVGGHASSVSRVFGKGSKKSEEIGR